MTDVTTAVNEALSNAIDNGFSEHVFENDADYIASELIFDHEFFLSSQEDEVAAAVEQFQKANR